MVCKKDAWTCSKNKTTRIAQKSPVFKSFCRRIRKETPSRWVHGAAIRIDTSNSSLQHSNRSCLFLTTNSAAELCFREIRLKKKDVQSDQMIVLLRLLTPSVSTTSTFPFASSSICLWILRMASKLRMAFSSLHSRLSMRQKSGREAELCGDDVNPQLWKSECLRDEAAATTQSKMQPFLPVVLLKGYNVPSWVTWPNPFSSILNFCKVFHLMWRC